MLDRLRTHLTYANVMVTIAAVATIALVSPANASGDSAPTTEPTLTIEEFCSDFPPEWGSGVAHGAWVVISGLEPFSSVSFGGAIYRDGVLIESGEGLIIDADETGTARVPFGDSTPFTIVITTSFNGGVAQTVSREIDCASPPEPATKDDCKNGGWRDFDFKNQGQCVSFVRHASREQQVLGVSGEAAGLRE